VPQSDIQNAALRMAGLYYDRFPFLLDWSNGQGRTALHIAALKGNEEFAKVGDLHVTVALPSHLRVPLRCSASYRPISTYQITRATRRYISEWLLL
jgi:uncharacterized protein